ncbi:hypothetical protein RND81_09G066700 [Saponaria officinalis]|uniref:Uncharacterized protein n=1 Tax=Saponaria officinalis TaxID=3572 RepID=A0AAW1IHR5_SAPOF
MANSLWFQANIGGTASFLTPGVSDHSPAVVNLNATSGGSSKQFKYLNGWVSHQGFTQLVDDIWHSHVRGTRMFRLFEKLKLIKKGLRCLHINHYSHISHRVVEARGQLLKAQESLNGNPGDLGLIQEEDALLQGFLKLQKAELSFYQQRAKIKKIQQNDENTSYYQAKVKEQYTRNKIVSISSDGDVLSTDGDIGQAFVSCYSSLLGPGPALDAMDDRYMEGAHISDDQHYLLNHPILDTEIKEALFSIDEDKAPGLDGITSGFFKSTWNITGPDLVAAVKDFFCQKQIVEKR